MIPFQALPTNPAFALVESIQKTLADFAWFWLVILLGFVFERILISWRQNIYLSKNPLVVLEVRIPREIILGPKAMEQVLANFNGLANGPGNFYEKYVDGEVPHALSLEIASFEGNIHFYITTPKRHQRMIEAHLYAQYPDLEIAPVEDYVDKMPATIQEVFSAGYDMMGSELILGEDDVYPIRSYLEFGSSEDAENLDPISAMIETLAKVNPGEQVWLQIVIRPTTSDWLKKGKKKIEELKDKAKVTKVVVRDGVKNEQETMGRLSPGEIETMEGIEKNIAKPAFETVIRYLYFAPQKAFNVNFGKRAVTSCLNQYKSYSMNFFKGNGAVSTYAHWAIWPYFFAGTRMGLRKASMLFSYRTRYIKEQPQFRNMMFGRRTGSKYFIMNIEKLATIYHFPSSTVLTAPFIQRVESRRTGPPAGLPIFSRNGENTTGFQFGPHDPSGKSDQPARQE